MLTVNIVVGGGDLGWIGGRFANELVARLPAYGITATINAAHGATHLDYHQIVYGEPERRPAVGLFTHGEFRPKRFAAAYDGWIALNHAMAGYLVDAGVEPRVIPTPVDGRHARGTPLVFGVAGRTYADGRKGEALVKHMVDAGFHVLAWGSGWPCRVLSARLEDLPKFYQQIDYYVDTSTDEGGCVPALEAAAWGKPVISHTLGVDRPVIPYDRGSWVSLHKVLVGLTYARTYEDWSADHAQYFREVAIRLGVAA